MTALPSRDCPICGDRRRDVVFRQTFSGSVEGNFLAGYDVAVCEACGFGFADGIPPQAEFDRYYGEASKYENEHLGGQPSADDLERFRSSADRIAPFVTPGARILEIGCANGGLLALLRDRGFPRVEGLDPSPACARAARELRGIPVATGTLSDTSGVAPGVDFLILVGVLEHLVDLGSAVERIRALCGPGGRVYVEVPDASRFAECVDAPFQQFSMEHVEFFSSTSLGELMRRHGFKTVSSLEVIGPHTANSQMPIVCAVFERTDAPSDVVARDRSTLDGLRAYVDGSRAVEGRLLDAIGELVRTREPVLVWGLGTLTRRLLATSPLDQANIQAFVDSNPHYHGKSVGGVPVIPPREAASRRETIVIASYVFQDEIERQIRNDLGSRSDLVRLADGRRVAVEVR